jgi:hypothetical protein
LTWLSKHPHLFVSAAEIDHDQLLARYALEVLYDSTNRSGGWSTNNWRNQSGTLTCVLDGVTCSNGEITRLELGKSNGALVSHCVQSSNTTMLT